MKTKRSNKKILPLLGSAILLLSIITGVLAPNTSAANDKIMVTDHDNSGDFSVGDEFCLGDECFYLIENADGYIRALSKYNLYAGGDTVNVSSNPDFQSQTNKQLRANQYLNGYINCDSSNRYDENLGYYVYSASVCYKSYDTKIEAIDISNRTDLINITTSDFYDIIDDEFGDYDDCLYDKEYRQDETNSWQYYTTNVYVCYSFNYEELTVKQDPQMISAHGDEKGEPEFPAHGDVYFDYGGFYDVNNNLVISEDYALEYVNNDRNYNHNIASYYLYEYFDILNQSQTIKDINLLSYNDLMHILNAINPDGITFEDDNYLSDDDSQFEWNENTDDNNIHNYDYWFTSLLDYIPDEYSWLYNTTYWLGTTWYWNTNNAHEDEYGNTGIWRDWNYQFFVDTLGDLCSVSGSCGTSIGAGLRPVITMDADLFELNTFFDINGTVRWIDQNNISNIRPNKSIIRLYRNGTEIDSAEVVKDEEEDLWHFTFLNLLKYDYDGNEYVYTVSQDNVPLYNSDVNDFNIVNRYAPIPDSPNTIDQITIYKGLGILTVTATLIGLVVLKTRR